MAEKSWLERQADEELRRRLRADAKPVAERAQAVGRATGKVLKYIAVTVLGLVLLAGVLVFHQVFPGFGPAAGSALLLLGGCYAVVSCFLISRRLDEIYVELKHLRNEVSDMRYRQ